MQYPRLRFSLFTLLALPTMFAIGWCARDRNYNRDVYAAADVIVRDAGRGVLIAGSDLILTSDRRFADRLQAMSPADQEEMKRRLEYYDKELKSSFAPPRPSMATSLHDLVTGEHEGTTAEEERAKRIEVENEERREFFRRVMEQSREGNAHLGDRGRRGR